MKRVFAKKQHCRRIEKKHVCTMANIVSQEEERFLLYVLIRPPVHSPYVFCNFQLQYITPDPRLHNTKIPDLKATLAKHDIIDQLVGEVYMNLFYYNAKRFRNKISMGLYKGDLFIEIGPLETVSE